MSVAANRKEVSIVPDSSWVFRLPGWCAETLTGIYIVSSQWNPCDSTSVANGDSLLLILLGIAIGIFSCADRLCNSQACSPSRFWRILAALFFGWLFLCTLCVLGRGNARIAFLGLWQTLAVLGVVASMFQMATSPTKTVKLFYWMIGLGLGSSMYALYQYAISMPRTRLQFEENPFPILQALGIQEGTAEALQWKNRLASMEPTGPFALANSLAGFLSPLVVGMVGILLLTLVAPSNQGDGASSIRSKRSEGLFRIVIVLCMGLISIVLLFTKSRTAWGACAIFVGLLPLLVPPLRQGLAKVLLRQRWIAIAGSLLFLGLMAVFLWRDPYLVSEAGKSLSYRLDYWKGAFLLLQRSPWIGYGPLQFQSMYATVKSMTASETPADPHNFWLEIAATGGIPLVALGLIIVASLLLQEYRRQKRTTDPAEVISSPIATPIPRSSIGFPAGAVTAFVGIFSLSFFTADDDTLVSAMLFGAASCLAVFAMHRAAISQILTRHYASLSLAMGGTLGVHFCFSGGWMQPGNMNIGAMCFAMLIASSKGIPRRQGLLRLEESCVGIAWLVCATIFGLWTCHREIRLQDWNLQLAVGAVDLKTPEAAKSSLQVHTWDPESARQVGELACRRSIEPRLGNSIREEWLMVYRIAREEYLARDPKNWQVHQQIGQWEASLSESELLQAEQQQLFSRGAIEASRRASELYPASISVQLQAAVYAYWQNSYLECEKYLSRVESIDQNTPHLDRKITASMVYVPSALEKSMKDPRTNGKASTGSPLNQDGLSHGEPVFRWLRTQIDMRK